MVTYFNRQTQSVKRNFVFESYKICWKCSLVKISAKSRQIMNGFANCGYSVSVLW